jgi:hypothetical protein
MPHNRHRGEGRDAEPLTGSSTLVSPSILASPRCDALRVHRHAAVFLGHRKLDRLPLSFEAGELLRRNVSAAEGRRWDPDPGNAAGCIAALRLFLLLRRLGQCRVDSFQFVGKVETTEAVVGDRADIGLSDAFRRCGASRQSRSDPQSPYKSRSAAHWPPRTIRVNDVSVASVRNVHTPAAGRGLRLRDDYKTGSETGPHKVWQHWNPARSLRHPSDRLVVGPDLGVLAQDPVDRVEHRPHARFRRRALDDDHEFRLVRRRAHEPPGAILDRDPDAIDSD